MQVNHCDSPCQIFFQIKIRGKEKKNKKKPCNKMEALCMVFISELLWPAKFLGTSVHNSSLYKVAVQNTVDLKT